MVTLLSFFSTHLIVELAVELLRQVHLWGLAVMMMMMMVMPPRDFLLEYCSIRYCNDAMVCWVAPSRKLIRGSARVGGAGGAGGGCDVSGEGPFRGPLVHDVVVPHFFGRCGVIIYSRLMDGVTLGIEKSGRD